MSDIQGDERMQRMQRELEIIPQAQQAMMQANQGLEMLIAVGGLSPAEVQFAQEAQLAIWQRAMVLEGIARGREVALAQAARQMQAPVQAPPVDEAYDELIARTATEQDAERSDDDREEDGPDLVC